MAKKWLRTPSDREAARRGYYFDQHAADHACDFYPRFLRHSIGAKWADQPFDLLPWEVDLTSRIHGWKRPDGTRRYTEVYVEIPKKNGKSAWLSGQCLYALIEEPGAGVYQGAVDKEQAAIVFREAARMAQRSPAFASRLQISDHYKTMVWKAADARFVCMSADVESKDGINPSFTGLDELHRFGRDRRLYDILEHAGAAREQPLRVITTTAGDDKGSLCYQIREQVVRILRGATDDLHTLGVIYSAENEDGSVPSDDELDDPRIWRKANPSLGVVIGEDRFREDWHKARRIPGRLASFKRLRLGIWTDEDTEWLPMPLWDAAARPAALDRWQGRVFAALDLGTKFDLSSLTLVMLDGDFAQWHSTYFMPREMVRERSRQDEVTYDTWAEDGHILLTPGNGVGFQFIIDHLVRLRDEVGLDIEAIGLDRWNQVHLGQLLVEAGFEVVFITQQGFANWTGPCGELDRRLDEGTLCHDGNPVTRFCAANVRLETDPIGNVRPSKTKSVKKIDGIVSGLMALGLATGTGYTDPTGGVAAI